MLSGAEFTLFIFWRINTHHRFLSMSSGFDVHALVDPSWHTVILVFRFKILRNVVITRMFAVALAYSRSRGVGSARFWRQNACSLFAAKPGFGNWNVCNLQKKREKEWSTRDGPSRGMDLEIWRNRVPSMNQRAVLDRCRTLLLVGIVAWRSDPCVINTWSSMKVWDHLQRGTKYVRHSSKHRIQHKIHDAVHEWILS